MICRLCSSKNITKYFISNDNKIYYLCSTCGLVFLDEKFLMNPIDEKNRYKLHNNNFDDPNYRAFLKQLFDNIVDFLNPNMKGLDFGCGSAKVLEDIFKKHGFAKFHSFDPYFANHTNLLNENEKYDFVVSTETIEHFYNPNKSFDLINKLINKNGFLGLMTSIFYENIDFKKWHYKNDPTHVAFYQMKTFDWLAKHYNFKIIKTSKNIVIFQKQGGAGGG